MLSKITIALIEFYQRHISPKKGFSCAYRVAHGGTGCSGYGKRVFARFGFLKAVKLLRRRLDKCSFAAAETRIKQSFSP